MAGRVSAIILWCLAVIFAAFAVLALTNMVTLPESLSTLSIIAIFALAFVCLVVGLLLWFSKKSAAKTHASTKAAAKPGNDVFWTPQGKSYHLDRDCRLLDRSKKVLNGTQEEAKAAGKTDPCDLCALKK